MSNTLLLVDISYCCFYRYHALCNWFKLANPDSILDCHNIKENLVFMDKFHKKFIDMFQDLVKKYQPNEIILAMDGSKNWRKQIYQEYKATRKNSNSQIYDDQIFIYLKDVIIPEIVESFSAMRILEPTAEGDDVISVLKKHNRNKDMERKIVIITSDTDMCQLIDENTDVYDLKGKNLRTVLEKDNLSASQYLVQKCILGDKSDNIPSVFPKCGKKTVAKYLENMDLFNAQLNSSPDYIERYKHNQLLINLDNIPQEIQDKIVQLYQGC